MNQNVILQYHNMDINIENKDSEVTKVTKPTKKELFLQGLELNLGNISEACKQANISRQTYYRWIEDESFSEQCDNVKEGLIDLAENQLLNKIKKGDITAIIFFLKCRGKKRGYTEKQEVEISKPITDINFDEL